LDFSPLIVLRLKSVSKDSLPEDSSAASGIEKLCKKTANDIHECSNCCDVYSRKKLIVKCLSGSIWDERLKKFVQLFSDRRNEFMFAMSIHVTVGVEELKEGVMDIKAFTQDTNEK